MPDKKLTDLEIVKALEDIIKHLDFTQIKSGENVLANALDLINRLQEENEKLTDKIESISLCYDEEIGQAKKEIERLNYENLQMIASIKHLKAEAYKEFAERCKECFPSIAGAFECFLKEFLEGRESS